MIKELSLNEEINIYIQSGLTPTELFILRLLFLAIDDDSTYLNNYLSNQQDGKKLFRAVLESLKEKKVILSTFKIPGEGEVLNLKSISFNKNFLKMYIRESNELGSELFEAYPAFININGKMCSIKNFTKAGLYSFEEFCLYYAKAIKSAKITHDRVMEAVEFGKANNLLNYSIIEFIASRKYLEIESMKEQGVQNFNSDTITCL